MNSLILIFKGFLIGIGKILPGISGSLIALSLGVYEKTINCLTNLFKDFINNILFLFKLLVGIMLALVLFSKIINYLLNTNYIYTMACFLGLFLGIIINVFKHNKYNKFDFLFILILIISVFLISNINLSCKFLLLSNVKYFFIIMLGIIDAITMILPAISGTAIFMVLDVYDFILEMYSDFNINYLFLYIFGILIGSIATLKLIAKFIKVKENMCYKIISYLSICSLFLLLFQLINYLNITNIIPFFFILIICFIISRKFVD